MTADRSLRMRGLSAAGFVLFVALLCSGPLRAMSALADTNAQVAAALTANDTYVSKSLPPSAHVKSGDVQRLMDATRTAVNSGVPEKIGLVSHYPNKYNDTYAAAQALRQYLDFAGVLVLVSPWGIGVSSDTLTLQEIQSIERAARPHCLTSWTQCSIEAGQLAVKQTKADTSAANKSAAVFWLVLLAVLAVIIGAAVLFFRGRRNRAAGDLKDLRNAASQTLSLADGAVEEIEQARATIPPPVRAEYDRALALRDRAKNELEKGNTAPDLTQANQDAATAVLALQGVMKSLRIQSALSNPLNSPTGHRCFYCGRSDRPPYVTRTIDDGKGNAMQIEVCSVDLARLEMGQTPQIQTAPYNGAMVPWWAVPNDPYYYSYGGPTWQYWLPLMIGLDVGGWYGGGWGGGYGVGDLNMGGGFVDSGSQMPDSGTVNPSTDSGAGDFGGWGGGSDASAGDAGGWGGDAGGAGDWGGGDSGGGGDSSGW